MRVSLAARLHTHNQRRYPQSRHACRFPAYGYGRAAGGAGRRIDDLFAAEIAPRLGSEHYLDFTGSGLYFNSQIAALAQVSCNRWVQVVWPT